MKWNILAVSSVVIVCYLAKWVDSKSLNLERSFVVRAEDFKHRQRRSLTSSTTRMHVKSVVKSRFARVTTTTTMQNSEATAKELTFSVRLPTNAFISKFSMDVDGITYVGKVKEKELAEEEYRGAMERGHSAGLVTAKVRETQTFNVAANAPAHSSVIFKLEYQELLKRRLGKYEHSLFINPGQIVDDLSVDMFITENTGITTLETHHPQNTQRKYVVSGGFDNSGEVDISVKVKRSKHQAFVSFKPTQAQQRQLLMISENERKVSVIYDVTREELGGEILMRDGYFVHFFAPINLPALPKRIVFVIDKSGSMSGRKMAQTKEAFATVLQDMSDADKFNIITFSSRAHRWQSEMVAVTPQTKERAINHVNNIIARGSTNFNDALLEAVGLLDTPEQHNEILSAIIALTDGEPTVGVTNEDRIRGNVKSAINGKISLFCLGFGESLNHDFLKKIANDNDGIARKIYADSDAVLQLRGFFQEVATPLLLNVNIRYNVEGLAEVSKTKIDKYFKGSEVVVVGTMRERALLEARITATNDGGEVEYVVTGQEIDDGFSHSEEYTGDFSNFVERLWAYFTINDLLEAKVLADTRDEAAPMIEKARALASKYGFVTPYTSMVVVRPEDEITTTAAATTITPIPVCLRRGDEASDDTSPPRIWCPYIFEGRRQETHESEDSRRPSPHYMLRSRASPQRRLHKFAFSSHARSLSLTPAFASRVSSPQRIRHGSPRLRMSTNYGRSYYYDDYWSVPDHTEPEVSSHCGAVLHATTGRITLPTNLRSFHSSTVYCDWEIEVADETWIDLYINKIRTTSTQVKITSNGEDILEHRSGRHGPKYSSVMTNSLKIRMTIDPTERKREVVTIRYMQFDPRTIVPDESETTADTLPDTFTCGSEITSSELLSGNISSPRYPSSYPSNTSCSWTFRVHDTNAYTLSLRIVDMDIETNELGECLSDRVSIIQGSEEERFCGIKENVDVDAHSDSLTVTFKSDGTIEGSGFQLEYEFLPN